MTDQTPDRESDEMDFGDYDDEPTGICQRCRCNLYDESGDYCSECEWEFSQSENE